MKAMALNPESFLKIMELMLTTHDTGRMLTDVTEEIRDYLHAQWCTLYIIDKNLKELYTKVCQKCIIDVRLPLDKKSIEGWCALTGKEICLNNAYDEREIKAIDRELSFNKSLDERCNVTTHNVLCVPIKAKGEAVGVFEIFNKPGGFIESNLEAVREFAFLLGIAVNNALIVEELKKCNEYLKKCQISAAGNK